MPRHEDGRTTRALYRADGYEEVVYAADARLLEDAGLLHKARTGTCNRHDYACDERPESTCPVDEEWAPAWALPLAAYFTRTGRTGSLGRRALRTARDDVPFRLAFRALTDAMWDAAGAEGSPDAVSLGAAVEEYLRAYLGDDPADPNPPR